MSRTAAAMTVFLWFLSLLQLAAGGNILVFNPTLGHSHVRFLGNMADMFARDGHNVTIISPIMDETVAPFGSSNPNISKIEFRSPYLTFNFLEDLDMKSASFWEKPEKDGISFDMDHFDDFMTAFEMIYKGILEDKQLLQSLKDSKFDLGMSEYFEIGSLGLFEILGIKTSICAASLGMIGKHYEITGLPQFTSFVPGYLTTFSDKMTLWERWQNMKIEYDRRTNDAKFTPRLEKMFREYYPAMPDLEELAVAKTGVILSNANEFTESARPKVTMVQYVGGTNVHPPNPLSEEINRLLDIRPSTVLLSFGTFIKGCQMPLELKTEILEAFSLFPEVTFLWKYENCPNDTTPFDQFPNVVPRPWWPQTDLLGDDRLSAFITHAGMNSMLEISFRGKPAVTIPLFGDQYINAKTSESIGMSTMIKRSELSKKTMIKALYKVLDADSQIAKKAKMAANVLKGKTEEYRREALRWVKLLLEYGPMPHHRLPSKHLNFLQLYHLDIFLFAFSLPFVGVALLFVVYRLLIRIAAAKQKKL